MDQVIDRINRAVWGVPMLGLILGVGLYLSFRTGFVQFRRLPDALGHFLRMLRAPKADSGISSFQALCTALAGTVGTGNLVGVAGAIAIGGPGSVFWMWICALIGMTTKYAEATLAVRYRKTEKGNILSGPMYMIENGLGKRWRYLGYAYCLMGVFAAFGVGNATQVNAMVTGIHEAAGYFGCPMDSGDDLILGLALALFVGFVLLGGAKRIGNAAELLIPFVSCVYLILCIGALALCYQRIPAAFASILQGAFSPGAVTGGAVGSIFQTLRIGVSRGVFTNEAGMGTASIAHGAAQGVHPCQQGLMGIMEVFIDTIVICTMTALVILCSGVPLCYGFDSGATLTVDAFRAVYGDWVSVFLAIALCCFAFATILGWGLYGGRCAQYLLGNCDWRTFALAQSVVVVLGAVLKTGMIWSLAEIMNGLMAIPNLLALVGLSSELFRLTREYDRDCGNDVAGGTYENIHQRKPVPTLTYAEVPPLRGGSKKTGQEDLSSEYWSAGPSYPQGILRGGKELL